MPSKIPIDEKQLDHIIEMAWQDHISFDAILRLYGIKEQEVIQLMRTHLKPSSFKMWRKRVTGRLSKHEGRLQAKNQI